MCSRKPKPQVVVQEAPKTATPVAPPTPVQTPAASVAAPTDIVESNVVSENQQRRKRAKGKKGLTIKTSGNGSGTGVNL